MVSSNQTVIFVFVYFWNTIDKPQNNLLPFALFTCLLFLASIYRFLYETISNLVSFFLFGDNNQIIIY